MRALALALTAAVGLIILFREDGPPRPAEVTPTPTAANPTAYLPPQCYARTKRPGASAANPCFTCHQEPRAPNYTADAEVQRVLSLPAPATTNPWRNLVSPPAPVDWDDARTLARVRQSNYFDARGAPVLATALPASWRGYRPDCAFHFDAEGFDRDAQGRATGWRAYAWAPVPGMFWPTNGSAGDAMIRLPREFREDDQGAERLDLYAINLAILEAMIRRVDVPLRAVDEASVGGVDLDGDGQLGVARKVAFVWPPREGRRFTWVGRAARLEPTKAGWPVAGLFPVGTEFLHSVRYLDVQDGRVVMAARLKELRYMRKGRWFTWGDLQMRAQAEEREKLKSPDRVRTLVGDGERGVGTGLGWALQGFIEDADGALRPQTTEETAACVGCHGGVGATTDGTFSFARKLGGAAPLDGWYHWGAAGLAGVPEPKRADGQGEYAHWLAQVGGGDDYRTNPEVQQRFFDARGALRPDALAALEHDLSTLLVPSPERALALDRAYLALVKAQSFSLGREVVVGGAPHLEAVVEQEAETGVEVAVTPGWWKDGR
ncbi:MAG: hypothetical protein ACOZQL_34920 [Myxococcota bacterium]